MLRLWNRPRLRVYLGDGYLAACSLSGGRHVRLLQHERRNAGRDDVAAVAADLAMRLSPRSSRTSLEFILGTAHVRYLLLPWDPALHDQGVRDRVAAALFARTFHEDSTLHEVRYSPLRFGQAQLAAFVAKDLLQAVQGAASRVGGRLVTVEPLLASIWNTYRARLSERQGVLLVAEGERLLALQHEGPTFRRLQLRPCMTDELGGQVEQLSTPGQASLFAPLQPRLAATSPAAWLAPDALASQAAGDDACIGFALCGVTS